MSALFALLALLQGPAADAASYTARVEAREVEVGVPLEIRCDVQHAPGASPRAEEPKLDPTSPWVFLDARREPARLDPSGAATTTLVWRLACLEPGDVEPPALFFEARTAEGRKLIEVDAEPVSVRGVLGADEDAPRPALGFRELAEEGEARAAWLVPVATALLLLVALAAAFALGARRALRRRPRLAPPMAERIAALRAQPIGERERQFALTHLVREALDERIGADRRGLTDEEWLAVLSADLRIPEPERRAASRVLAGAARAKYGGEVPTSWAAEETFQHALVAVGGGDGEER